MSNLFFSKAENLAIRSEGKSFTNKPSLLYLPTVGRLWGGFLIIAFLLLFSTAQAQNTFFPTKAGTKMLYAHKDAKGKVSSHTLHTIKNVEGSGNNLTISYVMESFDKNMKPQSNPPSEVECTVIIKDDVLFLDMNEMFIDQMKVSDLKVEITGVPIELPGNLQPGQSLKDANMTMTIDAGIMKMKTDIKITDSKCVAIEDITVSGGTFTCHKVTQKVTTTVLRKDIVSTSISWYAPGIGTIKTESYDSKNKMTGSTELIEINF